ncbi:unnamed protein product [Arctogadus glacialis]
MPRSPPNADPLQHHPSIWDAASPAGPRQHLGGARHGPRPAPMPSVISALAHAGTHGSSYEGSRWGESRGVVSVRHHKRKRATVRKTDWWTTLNLPAKASQAIGWDE